MKNTHFLFNKEEEPEGKRKMFHYEHRSSKDENEHKKIPDIISSPLNSTKTQNSYDNQNDDDNLDHKFEQELKESGQPSIPVLTGIIKEPTLKPNNKLSNGDDISGREKLKRHRSEVAGRVWIPDSWGHEGLLKDWIDCSAFDSSLFPNGLMSARAALIQEGRRPNSGGLRI